LKKTQHKYSQLFKHWHCFE